MVTCTSRTGYIFPLMSDKPLYTLYMTPPPLDMLDTSEPRPCWNKTSDGWASSHLSMLSSWNALYANRSKLITTLLIPHLLPSHHSHPCPSNNSQSTWLQIYHPWMDMIYWWLWLTTALQIVFQSPVGNWTRLDCSLVVKLVQLPLDWKHKQSDLFKLQKTQRLSKIGHNWSRPQLDASEAMPPNRYYFFHCPQIFHNL